mmetsp:Transcript_14210/g.29618  ORF Transcript_14210/g.29618 Transcript_14210/m.29618 type:complete len:372 (+) Transcript_14210:89-1204(+)|eukprot:CAMPEP_0201140704 /NCGR_PEP_ID=MMETSP0851-20130426/2294_1 /ASSEMBLY_ACC=CAM_ASM_000631 /TAXON_ID=183588 /ORGANISM="Pseudo-nitzschia fraudulenta, Strain WWA7" /LENGTH=371 /DNA_ID=CAMNT_0047413393 /DNA_START=90 /DNA_END=1205 /DNA_ORIENTATION=-
MIIYGAIVFVCSFLFHIQGTNGYSTVQPPSLGRSNNIDLALSRSSFARNPANGRINFVKLENHVRNFLPLRERTDEGAGSEVESEDAALQKKLAGRKKRLKVGYQLSFMAYVVSAVYSLFSWGSVSPSSLYYILGGGALSVAPILHILKGAAINDRLGSDTYKRLNIAVVSYALVQLVMPAGNLGLPIRLSSKVPAFLALTNGIKGYGYGCLGWDKSKDVSTVLTDIKEGTKSTLQGLTVVKPKSVGYIFGTLLLGSMFCLKVKELCQMLIFSSAETATYFSISTRLSKLARFGLMTTVLYTLKDACDRDRLSGTTFVQLNFVASAAFLSIALYLLPIYGKLSSNGQVLIAAGLSLMTFLNGIVNMKARKE